MVNLKKIFSSKEPIKIGNLAPMSGVYTYYGEWERNGVDLAVDQINKKGGINGQKVIILREDDRVDPALSRAVLARMIDTEHIQAVIGSASSEVVLADAPIVDKNKVAMITPLAGAARISTASSYIFRIYPTAGREGEKLVEVARQLGYKQIAVLYINNSFGMDLAKSVRRQAAQEGIEVLLMEGYRKDEVDFSEQLGRIKEKNPGAIFLLGYPQDTGLVLKQARELGIESKYLAPDTIIDPSFAETAGKASEGIIYVGPNEVLSPKFAADFKKKYKKEPNVFNALAFDALNLLALAIERGGYDGTAIRDEMLKIKDYPGASGIITFDEHGDAMNLPLNVKTIKEGKAINYQ